MQKVPSECLAVSSQNQDGIGCAWEGLGGQVLLFPHRDPFWALLSLLEREAQPCFLGSR